MKKEIEYTTITIKKSLRDDLMIIKIKSNAKNLNDVIEKAIPKLREQLK